MANIGIGVTAFSAGVITILNVELAIAATGIVNGMGPGISCNEIQTSSRALAKCNLKPVVNGVIAVPEHVNIA